MAGARIMTVDEFLAYDTRSRSEFLGAEWKEKGWLQAWLHRRQPIATSWQHSIPRIDVRDNPETRQPQRSIFNGSIRCMEEDDVLKAQYKRDRQTGARETPPLICPPCKMIEYIHDLVITQQIHWLEPIFDFDVGDPKSRIYLRASGMWNGYKLDKLDDERKLELNEAGISPKFGWKENLQSGLKYIFCLVDHDAPAKGIQIMKEGPGLGDKVKIAIAKEMKRNPRNPALGDPVANPYAFCFEYKEDEVPAKKYDAYRVELELTEQINQLITDTPSPDISAMYGNYDMATLRSQLEKAALVELPWDEWFTQEAEDTLAAQNRCGEGREAASGCKAPHPSRTASCDSYGGAWATSRPCTPTARLTPFPCHGGPFSPCPHPGEVNLTGSTRTSTSSTNPARRGRDVRV